MIRTIPAEKLLIYNVKQGWEPLADLLGVDVPDEPFPRINDGATVNIMVVGSYYMCVIGFPILLLCLLFVKSSRFKKAVVRIFGLCRRKTGKRLSRLGKTRNSDKFDNVIYANVNP